MSIGVPGSGKSSVMKKIAEWGSFEYTGPDVIRLEKHNDETNHEDDKAIWVELRDRVANALKEGKSIVVDSTFHTLKRREHFMAFVREYGAEIEGLSFDIPLETILSRSIHRAEDGGKSVSTDYIEKVYKELQQNRPKPEEGFNALMCIDQTNAVNSIQSSSSSLLSIYFSEQNRDQRA